MQPPSTATAVKDIAVGEFMTRVTLPAWKPQPAMSTQLKEEIWVAGGDAVTVRVGSPRGFASTGEAGNAVAIAATATATRRRAIILRISTAPPFAHHPSRALRPLCFVTQHCSEKGRHDAELQPGGSA